MYFVTTWIFAIIIVVGFVMIRIELLKMKFFTPKNNKSNSDGFVMISESMLHTFSKMFFQFQTWSWIFSKHTQSHGHSDDQYECLAHSISYRSSDWWSVLKQNSISHYFPCDSVLCPTNHHNFKEWKYEKVLLENTQKSGSFFAWKFNTWSKQPCIKGKQCVNMRK